MQTARISLLAALTLITGCRDRDRHPPLRTTPLPGQESPASVPTHGAEPRQGPSDAPVTITAFLDYTCPATGRVAGVLDALRLRFGSGVQVMFKLPSYPSPGSVLAARAACAADLQGRFALLHPRLAPMIAHHGIHIERRDVLDEAAAAGLELERFGRDLDSAGCTQRLVSDRDHADALEVPRTPTFFVDGTRVGWAHFESELDRRVSDLLARKSLAAR